MTCGSDKKLKLWNPYRNLLLKTYGGHGNEVLDACGSCDSSQIVSCSSDKSVIVWDVSTGQPLRRLRGHAATVTCVKFNEESTVAVSGSQDNSVCCWDVRSRSQVPIQTLKEAKDCITSVQVSDYEILTGSVDCSIRRYDMRNGCVESDFLGSAITSVAFSHDGQCLLASSTDSVLRLLDKNSGELLGESVVKFGSIFNRITFDFCCRFTGHNIADMNIECSIINNDSYVMCGSISGELFCWDLINSKIINKLCHTQGKVLNSLSVHPKEDVILTACVNTVKIWSKNDILVE